jgi:hypothetical protein
MVSAVECVILPYEIYCWKNGEVTAPFGEAQPAPVTTEPDVEKTTAEPTVQETEPTATEVVD